MLHMLYVGEDIKTPAFWKLNFQVNDLFIYCTAIKS